MGVHDLADDGQAEARAARLRREERVEDAILQVVDAGAVVRRHRPRGRHRIARRAGAIIARHVCAVMVTVPRPSRASKAFETRLVNTGAVVRRRPRWTAVIRHVDAERGAVARAPSLRRRTASCSTRASGTGSTCRRIGRTKSSTSMTMALAILASLMMSVSVAWASLWPARRRCSRPAITLMPASGFFTSCAIAAAISPSARGGRAAAPALRAARRGSSP